MKKNKHTLSYLLTPDYMFATFADVTPEFLESIGISALLIDIDNTLAPYEQPEPDRALCEWLASLAAHGIAVGLLSNNNKARVSRFNATLSLPARAGAGKPFTRAARRIMRALGGDKHTTAVMGDQIFTDVWMAHAMGVRAILVPPIRDKKNALTRFKRRLERAPLRRYYRRCPDAPDVRAGSPLAKEIQV